MLKGEVIGLTILVINLYPNTSQAMTSPSGIQEESQLHGTDI